MELTSLYEYYERQEIAPTFADLRDDDEISAYAARRRALLEERLAIPTCLLRGAEILEYGPDTGENAVSFARFGARMTLVEPALAAHAQIRSYFDRYAPPGALRDVVAADVLSFEPERGHYDLVVAEGFIYTVQPSGRWLDIFARALVPGGLALLTYYERCASLFELLLKVPFAALRRRERAERVAVAERLYRPKWDSIPHTRAFASWVMDVLDNPFVRLRYFIDAAELVRDAAARGFGIHAAWPAYTDSLQNGWAKRAPVSGETVARTLEQLERSVLTYCFGTKAYLVERAEAAPIAALLDAALCRTDALIDAEDPAAYAALAATLRALAAASRAARTIVDASTAAASAIAALEGWAVVFDLFAADDVDGAVALLRADPVLVATWGTPTHITVLRAGAGS
jgi:hypothetical protein